MSKPVFQSIGTQNLWMFSLYQELLPSLQKFYGMIHAEDGGKWGMTDQEFLDRYAKAIRSIHDLPHGATAGQGILESGWAWTVSLFGVKSTKDQALGDTDLLFGLPSFHPNNHATEFSTQEFNGAGELGGTSASFFTGTPEEQVKNYVDLVDRKHPLAFGMSSWKYLHYINRPDENGSAEAYSTAPWRNSDGSVIVDFHKTWKWNDAWMAVMRQEIYSEYAKSVSSVVNTAGFDLW